MFTCNPFLRKPPDARWLYDLVLRSASGNKIKRLFLRANSEYRLFTAAQVDQELNQLFEMQQDTKVAAKMEYTKQIVHNCPPNLLWPISISKKIRAYVVYVVQLTTKANKSNQFADMKCIWRCPVIGFGLILQAFITIQIKGNHPLF